MSNSQTIGYTGGTKNGSSSHALLGQLMRAETQYPPLNAKEEREMIAKYKDDPATLKKMLVNHNIRMVFAYTQRYSATAYDYDEMVGNALYGLVIAADRFDIERKIKFATYAQQWIRKMALRQYYENEDVKIRRNSISMDMPITSSNSKSTGEGVETMANYLEGQMLPEAYGESEHVVGVKPNDVIESDTHKLFKKMSKYIEKTDGLNALERKVFIEMYLNHKAAPDIAKQFNVTNPAICFIRKKLNTILQEYLVTELGITSSKDVFCN